MPTFETGLGALSVAIMPAARTRPADRVFAAAGLFEHAALACLAASVVGPDRHRKPARRLAFTGGDVAIVAMAVVPHSGSGRARCGWWLARGTFACVSGRQVLTVHLSSVARGSSTARAERLGNARPASATRRGGRRAGVCLCFFASAQGATGLRAGRRTERLAAAHRRLAAHAHRPRAWADFLTTARPLANAHRAPRRHAVGPVRSPRHRRLAVAGPARHRQTDSGVTSSAPRRHAGRAPYLRRTARAFG